jgi:hypothetical protein
MDSDLVMIPKFRDDDDGCCKSTVYRMQEVYGAYIRQKFCESEQSQFWILLKKRDEFSEVHDRDCTNLDFH